MKTISIYSKAGDVIINIDYIVSIRKKYHQYGFGKHDYIITMVKGDDIIVESFHFQKVEEKLKEMGVHFDD